MSSIQLVSEPADRRGQAVPVRAAAGRFGPTREGAGVGDGGLGHLGGLAPHPQHHREELHLVGAGARARAAPGVPAGPGVGPPAAAEFLEEAPLPPRGEWSEADTAYAGQGQRCWVWAQQ